MDASSKLRRGGQVSIYVILGVLILALIAGITVTNNIIKDSRENSRSTSTTTWPLHVQQVNSYVMSCLEETSITGLFLAGAQGGYITVPQENIETTEGKIAFAYAQGINKLVSLETVEQEVASFIETTLPLCVDFSRFHDLTINHEDPKVRVDIRDDDLLIALDYPLYITKGETSSTVGDISYVEVPIKLKKIHEVINEAVKQQVKNNKEIDTVFLLNSGYDIGLIPYDESIILSVSDKGSMIKEVPFTFMVGLE